MPKNPEPKKNDRVRDWLRLEEAKADLEGDDKRAENMNTAVEALERDRRERGL